VVGSGWVDYFLHQIILLSAANPLSIRCQYPLPIRDNFTTKTQRTQREETGFLYFHDRNPVSEPPPKTEKNCAVFAL